MKNEPYTNLEKNILTMISEWCEYDCGNKMQCSEEECILYNIEKEISNNKY